MTRIALWFYVIPVMEKIPDSDLASIRQRKSQRRRPPEVGVAGPQPAAQEEAGELRGMHSRAPRFSRSFAVCGSEFQPKGRIPHSVASRRLPGPPGPRG